MKNDPRRTTIPPPPIEPTGFFTGIQIRPIIVGIVVDYLATYIAMAALIFGYLARESSKEGEISGEFIAEYMTSTEGLMAALVIGSLCTALGGFVAARKAGVFETKHGAFVGVGSLLVSFLEQLVHQDPVEIPEWFRFVSIVAIIPAGAIGGLIAVFLKDALGLRGDGGKSFSPPAAK